MEAVFPPNLPEVASLLASLASSIGRLLARGALPRRTAAELRKERRGAYERIAAIRAVSLGAHHPETRAAEDALRALK